MRHWTSWLVRAWERYYLERYIGQSKLGASFLAHADQTTTYLLRFLEGPVHATTKEREAYLEHFHYRAGQIAALKHPHILPLVDFGVFRGLPYLVTPHIPLRSLRIRIDKNGALNTFTVGRYLDQIATALEYAHEHGVLHGDLSVDTIFIRLDGQLVVTDFGVRSLLEMNGPDKPRKQTLCVGRRIRARAVTWQTVTSCHRCLRPGSGYLSPLDRLSRLCREHS